MSTRQKLEDAARKSNDMVIGASLTIMDTGSSEETRAQARVFQSIFSGITAVLSDAARGYWEPGQAPDDWESHDSSRAALQLADSILEMEQNAAGAR